MTNTRKMTILRYNERKGYGRLVAGELEATFKSHQLQKAGFVNINLPEGLPMEVELEQRDNGKYRVKVIHSVGGKPAQSAQTTKRTQYGVKLAKKPFRELPIGTEAEAEVRSYNEKGGYGFMTILGDENRDVGRVFFHVTNVPKDHKQLLAVGAIFRIIVGEGKKGSTALVQEPYFSDAELEELAAMPMQLPDGKASDDEAA